MADNILTRWLDKRIEARAKELIKAERGGPKVTALFGGEAGRVAPGVPIPTVTTVGEDTQERTERLAVTSAWVWSDIDLICSEFSKAAFNVVEASGEGEEEIKAHPFEQLLVNPNPHMGRSYLWRYSVQWFLLRGEAYWWLVPDGAGELAEIWPIPSSRIEPIPDADEYIRGYAYRPRAGGKIITIPPDRVCFFRRPNPFDFHRGLSPMSAARLGLETDYWAARWNRDTFQNDVTIRTVISLDKEMGEVEFEHVRADLIDDLINNRLRYLITRGGDATVEQMGLSQKDAEYLAGRAFTRDELDRMLDVPPAVWSAATTTKAAAEAAMALLLGSNIYPLHVLWAETITAQILKRRYGENIRGHFEDVRPRDRALLVQERRTYWQVKTVDEARQDLGMEPLGDPETGAQLVPQAVRAGTQGGGWEMLESSATEAAEAAKADLRRWESVARRRLKAGDDPASYDFESPHIDPFTAAAIKAQLTEATTDEEVRAAFAAGFPHGRGWEGYP